MASIPADPTAPPDPSDRRATDDPIVPFTPVELEIAMLAGKGYGNTRIAAVLHRSPGAVRQAIVEMARRLANPDDIPPLTLVQFWGAHRIWLAGRAKSRDVA